MEASGGTETIYLYGYARLSQIEDGSAEWFLGDALGSVRQIVDDDNGDVILARDYAPFGLVLSESGSGASGYAFTGEQFDAIGLIYLRARYFDPSTGRFVSKDPFSGHVVLPQTFNVYAYCFNNAINCTDPSGDLPPWLQKILASIRQFADVDNFRDNYYPASDSGLLSPSGPSTLLPSTTPAATPLPIPRPTAPIPVLTPPPDTRYLATWAQRDRFFSMVYPGSGPNGIWTEADWAMYNGQRAQIWRGRLPWRGAQEEGIDRFVAHLDHLAACYEPGQEELFVHAIGNYWGGVPLGNPRRAFQIMALNPGWAWGRYWPLYEGTANWDPTLVDDENPSHHYAGLFYTGYYLGPLLGYGVGVLRDGRLSGYSPQDLNLGDIAVSHGAMLRHGIISMDEVGLAARYALDVRPATWPSDMPGVRVPWYYLQPAQRSIDDY